MKAQIPLSHLLAVCIWLPLKVGWTHSADILCNVFWVPCLRAVLQFFSKQRARAVSWIKRHRSITDTEPASLRQSQDARASLAQKQPKAERVAAIEVYLSL